MGAGIYRAKYEFVSGSLSQEQFEFIENNIYCSDDGTYELGNEKYRELKKRFNKRTELNELFATFEKEIKKGNSHFSFRVFG